MINWIKRHKFILLLALVLAILLNNSGRNPIGLKPAINYDAPYGTTEQSFSTGIDAQSSQPSRSSIGFAPPSFEKVSDSSQRVVIQNSSLSLLVKNVRETGDKILSTTRSLGGFMVDLNYNNPSEQGFATITVRVPTEKLDQALSEFRSYSVKVTSENLMGTDVTEQYEDLDQRIATLKKTKAKFESILDDAKEIDDIIRVNQEIINLEQQIDFATGQKLGIEDNARLTKITIYLSTDELALPYTPDEAFRPDVIFKKAVRSLLSTVQNGGELLIWLGVYSVIWIPIVLIIIVIKKRKRKITDTSSTRTSRLN